MVGLLPLCRRNDTLYYLYQLFVVVLVEFNSNTKNTVFQTWILVEHKSQLMQQSNFASQHFFFFLSIIASKFVII